MQGFCIRYKTAIFVSVLVCICLVSCQTTEWAVAETVIAEESPEEIVSPAQESGPDVFSIDEPDILTEDGESQDVSDESELFFTGSRLLGTVPYAHPDGDDITITISLWETGERKEKLEKVFALYEKEHPWVNIVSEFVDYPGYWGNVAADAAGGRLSDIIEMDVQHIAQFVSSNLLFDLSTLLPELGGYGLATGMTADAMQYDGRLLSELGIDFPDPLTLDAFFQLGEDVFRQSGIPTSSSLGIGLLEAIAAYNGGDIYSEIRDDVSESAEIYFSIVERVSSSPFFAETGSWNSFVNAAELDGAMCTVPVSYTGIEPYALLSISSVSENVEEVFAFLLYIISSEDAGEIMRLSFGIPSFREIDSLSLSADEKAQLDYVASIGGYSSVSIPPVGNSEIARVLSSLASEVKENVLEPDEAAQSFIDESRSILIRAEKVGR